MDDGTQISGEFGLGNGGVGAAFELIQHAAGAGIGR